MIALPRLNLPAFPYDRVRVGLLLLAFISSFIWIQKFELGLAMATLGLATLAYVLQPAHRLWPDTRSFGQCVLLILMVGYCGLIWAHGISSDIPALSVLQGGFYTLPVLVALTLMTLERNSRSTLLLWRGIYVVLALLAAHTLISAKFFDYSHTYRPAWPFADANHMAMMMNVGLVFAATLLARKTHSRAGIMLGVLCWLGLLATGSRGALIALTLVGFLIAGMMAYAQNFSVIRVFKQRRTLALFAIAAVLAIAAFLLFPGRSPLLRLTDLFFNPTQFFSSRPLIWQAVLSLIFERPLWGYGPGSFVAVYPEVVTPAQLNSGYAAHNDFLHLWLELGIFGAGLYAAIALLIFGLTLRALKAPQDPEQKIILLGSFAALMVIMAHAQIEFMIGVLPLMMMAGILIGTWWRALPVTKAPPVTPRLHYWAGQIAGALFVIMATLSMTQTYAEICLRQSDLRLMRGDVPGFARLIDTAQRWSLDLHAFPYLRTANFQLALLMSASSDPRVTPESVQELIEQTRARNPHLSAVWETQGRLDTLMSRDPVPAWRKGLSIEPRNASLRLLLLRHYKHLGRGVEARALATDSVRYWDLRGPKDELRKALKHYDLALPNAP